MPNSTNVDTLDRYYYDKERDRVKNQYKADLAALDTNKNVQMQEAAINNELLKKYLPQMNQMSGLSGLGVLTFSTPPKPVMWAPSWCRS